MNSNSEKWHQYLRAVQVSPRSESTLTGASGIKHNLIALGVSESTKRIAAILPAPSGREAALAQADLQLAYPDWNIIVARPATLSLAAFAVRVSEFIGSPHVLLSDLTSLAQRQDDVQAFFKSTFERGLWASAPIGFLPYLQQAIQQLENVRFQNPASITGTSQEEILATPIVDLTRLIEHDPIGEDLMYGVCPIPLLEVGKDELEILFSGSHVDDVKGVLARHNVYQYYFPSRDTTALALIERSGGALEKSKLRLADEMAAKIGHPFGDNAILPPASTFEELLTKMGDAGLCVEGKLSVEISPSGKTVRQEFQYKPRESIVSKIINKLAVSFSLADLFKK